MAITEKNMRQPSIDLPLDAIAAFCRKWKITEFPLFGSVLRDDFLPKSDVDVLVRFAPDANDNYSLRAFARMANELSDLLGRIVDLVSRDEAEQSANWIRRQENLHSAEVYYAA
jgi:predicted nucleotidyltransferase